MFDYQKTSFELPRIYLFLRLNNVLRLWKRTRRVNYLTLAGGLRLREVSLPEEEDDRDLDLDDDDPEYDDEPVVTDGDAAFGFPAGLAIAPTSLASPPA